MNEQITCLAGGVGAARFLQGLLNVVSQNQVTVIVNTGDDIQLHGLHVSPDLDIVMYTLAGIVDHEKGWGIHGDTFSCLGMLKQYKAETWFWLGDQDLATHIYRTYLLRKGHSLSEATTMISRLLGLGVNVLPMSNDRIETKILTDVGAMHFQEYLVKRRAKDDVTGVLFEGAEKAQPAPGVTNAILNADAIIICPSNPIVSIGAILSLKDVRRGLIETDGKVTAVSPIVGGAPIKGPADKLMRGLGLEVSAYSVAHLYQDFLDSFVLDHVDMSEKERIKKLGINTAVTNTIMKSLRDKTELARIALECSRLPR